MRPKGQAGTSGSTPIVQTASPTKADKSVTGNHPPRISVVGAGLIGHRHIELVAASAECELASVVDPSTSARRIATSFGVDWFDSLSGLLSRDRPDGIIVATPNHLHLEHALECIEAGVPTLLEKPIATSVEDGLRIVRASETQGVPLLIGHHRRHSPFLRSARQVVDSGALGRLVSVHGASTFRKPDKYFDEGPWRRRVGGGPLLINMIHEIDSLRYLCGEIIAVQAISSSAARGFEVEDTVTIGLRFDGGVLGSFMLSDVAASAASWDMTVGENPAFPVVPDVDCYVLAGDIGSIGIPTMRLRSYRGVPSWTDTLYTDVVPVSRRDPLEEQLAHFCTVIRGEATPLVSGWDGVQNVLVTEAIITSARYGTIVATPWAAKDS